MWTTPEFWVLVSFLIFVAAIGKRAFAFVTSTLDAHQKKVSEHIEEAQRLQDEAHSLLKTYKQKHKDALKQAEDILAFASTEAAQFQSASEDELKKFVKHKEKALLERIERDKLEALQKLKDKTVEEAVALATAQLAKESKLTKNLTKDALEKISRLA